MIRALQSAENDNLFRKSKETFQQTSAKFTQRDVFCKPVRQSQEFINGLRYPLHPVFRHRIDINTWAIFNADLIEEIYHSADYCFWIQGLCPLLLLLRCRKHRELHKVVGHYNRVLFHPMLIDAQIFQETHGGGEHSYTITTVSFLVARDADHFRTFPRPVVGVSSGYRPINSFYAPEDYCVEPTPVVPDRALTQVPAFKTMHELSPALVAEALVRFPVEGEKVSFSILEFAGFKGPRQPYGMAPDWVEFFEYRTDTLPGTGAHGEPNPAPVQQQCKMPGCCDKLAPQHVYMAPLSDTVQRTAYQSNSTTAQPLKSTLNPHTYAAVPNPHRPNSSFTGAQQVPSGAVTVQVVPMQNMKR